MMCDRLAPGRHILYRSPDVFGHERAPAQKRTAPLCPACLSMLEKAGDRGLVEVVSGARWTLGASVTSDTPPPAFPALINPAAAQRYPTVAANYVR